MDQPSSSGQNAEPSGDPARARVRDFEPDVERLHRPIYRELRDPIEGREPVPWWLWAVTALVLFWAGWYLGRHGGPFDTTAHVAYGEPDAFVAEQAQQEKTASTVDPVETGQAIYGQNCQTCHQANGQGLPGVFPPLVGSEWVTGPPETVIRIVLHGLTGPVEVAGRTYNGVMPAWTDVLTDEEISAVVTFIRQWETNDAGPAPPELVIRVRGATADRRQPWTADELRQLESQP